MDKQSRRGGTQQGDGVLSEHGSENEEVSDHDDKVILKPFFSLDVWLTNLCCMFLEWARNAIGFLVIII